MIRRSWPTAIILSLLLGATRPATAAKQLSIEKMEELLLTLHGKPDSKVSGELDGVRLTERASPERLARWEAELQGPHAKKELMKLADLSAFLDPPASDVILSPRPDVKTQLQLLKSAVEYVSNTLPRLPDFYATRTTTHFENNSSLPSFSAEDAALELSAAGTFSRTVTYRDGHEISFATAKKEQSDPATGLTTDGEFGPILVVVVGDALQGKLLWLRWERGARGPLAVFSYSVPQTESHFLVGLGNRADAERILPAYHGEIAIDPTTGAIERLSQIADMTAPNRAMRAEIVVDYAPVTIAGRNYICPVSGVAYSLIPLNSAAARMAATNRRGGPVQLTLDQSSGPAQIRLNDIAFTNYHEFRAEARIVSNASEGGATAGNDTAATESTAGAAPGANLSTSPSAAAGTEEAAKTAPNVSENTNAGASVADSGAGSSSARNAAPPVSAGTAGESEAAENRTEASNSNAPSELPAGNTVLHEQSKLVLVDVVVTDHGKPVKGLDRARFHVLDDGHEQNITSFEEIASATTAALVRPPALPPGTYSNLPAYPNTGAVNVLLLDGLNTEATDKLYVRREMIRYLKTLPPGQQIAIFTLGAQLRLIQGFTGDTGKLLAMLADKKTAAPESLRQAPEQKVQDQAELDQMTDAEISPQDIANVQDFFNEAEMQQTALRVDMTLEAMEELARYLSGIPGRKNVIWFSGSFPLQFIAVGSDPAQQIALNAGGLVSEQVRDTADLLAAERIAVYPVDARGVLGQSMFDPTVQAQDYTRPSAPAKIGGGPNRFSTDTQLAALTTDTEHSSMDVLAQETGGRAVYDSNGLKEALADALSDGSNFYSIAYIPPPRKDGQQGVLFHSVEVKVDGERYHLAYRRGYYTEDPNKPAEAGGKIPDAMMKAAVEGTPPSTEILFRAQVAPEAAPGQSDIAPDDVQGEKSTSFAGGTRRCEVDLSVPLQSLSLTEGRGGGVVAQLRTVLIAYGEDGQELNSVGRAFHFDLPADQYSKLTAQGGAISARVALDLPIRDVALRIVVYDPASARTGSMEIPLSRVPKQTQARSSAQ